MVYVSRSVIRVWDTLACTRTVLTADGIFKFLFMIYVIFTVTDEESGSLVENKIRITKN